MSIKELEKTKNDYINKPIYHGDYEIGLFMVQTIDILKDLIQEQQDVYKQLAKKEDAIDISNIKEVKRLINE